MKISAANPIFFIIAFALVSLLLSCNPPNNQANPTRLTGNNDPATSGTQSTNPNGTANSTAPVGLQEPLNITVDEEIDSSGEPPLHLYTVNIENLQAAPDEEVGINFVYEITQPTGEATYLLNDPTDPSSGVKSDENGPIIYRVVETVEKRVEDWGDPSLTQRVFMVDMPQTAYKIRYWVEVVRRRTSDVTEKELMDVPYISADDMIMQGGQIMTIPE